MKSVGQLRRLLVGWPSGIVDDGIMNEDLHVKSYCKTVYCYLKPSSHFTAVENVKAKTGLIMQVDIHKDI